LARAFNNNNESWFKTIFTDEKRLFRFSDDMGRNVGKWKDRTSLFLKASKML
jgi:hypothetical protein